MGTTTKKFQFYYGVKRSIIDGYIVMMVVLKVKIPDLFVKLAKGPGRI